MRKLLLLAIAILALNCRSEWSPIGGGSATSGSWKAPVANVAALPVVGNSPGDCHTVTEVGVAFCWTGTIWVHGSSTLLNGLIAYWSFDGNAHDATANANHFTTFSASAPTYTTGMGSTQAITFDGSQYARLPYNSTLYPSGDLTLNCWVNTGSTATGPQIMGTDDDTAAGFNFALYLGNKIYYRLHTSGGQVVLNSSTFTYDTWAFMQMKWDSVNNVMYSGVNGTFASVTGPGAGPITNLNHLLQAGNVMTGKLSQCSYYSRLTTATEDACLYGGGTPPTYPFTGVCL